MKQEKLLKILDELLSKSAENEILEFKEAKRQFDFEKLGKLFSALANEANLHKRPYAWLIFGVRDVDHAIVGSDFRLKRAELDNLKGEIAEKMSERITFIEIYEVVKQEKRVLMFQIPAAPEGMPIAFSGHYYGRDGERIAPLNIEEIERIRSRVVGRDWSAEVVAGASIEDLDNDAIAMARKNYKSKFIGKADEVDTWDDKTFLNKAKLTIKGKVTRAAILLLGKEESEHYLNPANPKIRWVLKDISNNEKDYEIFTIPLLLAVDKVFAKIRNLKYRYLRMGTLFPEEVLKYEPYVIREAINNSIAHQDYMKRGLINVVEMEDEQLIFTNYGNFIPGSVEKVVMEDSPEEQYRNPFLATAMFNLKMVDTAGGGIRKMFNYQRMRFFPMPEYDLTDDKVKVTIYGKVLDEGFANLLARNPDVSLEQIIMLDKVAKKKIISDEEAKHLRLLKLIEGRKPNYYISFGVAANTKDDELKAQYIKQRGFDDAHYRKMIMDYLETYGTATRSEVDALLVKKLPDVLDEKQKKNKVGNLLKSLRQKQMIKNSGTYKNPLYVKSEEI